MPAAIDLTGQVFTRLTVLEPRKVVQSNITVTAWFCRCVCGNTLTVPTTSLRTGNTRSCGCLKGDVCGAASQARAKKITDCPHIDRKHYGKGMCRQCWHRKINYPENAKRLRKKARKKYRNNLEYRRKVLHAYRGGVDFYKLVDLLNAQHNICLICKKIILLETVGNRSDKACFDHDHAHCKKGCLKCFRGYLCTGCNFLVGMAKDSPSILEAAKKYLEEWISRQK